MMFGNKKSLNDCRYVQICKKGWFSLQMVNVGQSQPLAIVNKRHCFVVKDVCNFWEHFVVADTEFALCYR